MTDHYKVLGVRRRATEGEIKAAFRALAREHHPDVAGVESTDKFMAIKEAYETLSDAGKRSAYDAALTYMENRARQEQNAQAARAQSQAARDQYFQPSPPKEARTEAKAEPRPTSVGGPDILRLTTLFRNGRLKEAEEKAMDILAVDSRQPVALAVIADIARMRGNYSVAQKYYALAAQYDPSTEMYLRRQQEMLEALGRPKEGQGSGPPQAAGGRPGALGFAALLVFGSAVYVAAMRDPALGLLPLVSSWPSSMLIGLGGSGLILGAMLSASNAVGRFSVTQGGLVRVPPGLVLVILSLINFWFASVFYLVVGSIQRAMNESILRLLGAVAAVVFLFGLAGFTRSTPLLWQTLVWGGNLVYLAAVAGWFVADALKPRG